MTHLFAISNQLFVSIINANQIAFQPVIQPASQAMSQQLSALNHKQAVGNIFSLQKIKQTVCIDYKTISLSVWTMYFAIKDVEEV